MATLFTQLSVILSLVLMEALLSVDNALVLAAMVAHLSPEKKKKALNLGMLGAYVLRGAALAVASFLIANPWIKVAGALYLLYVMCDHLGGNVEEQEAKKRQGGSFGSTVAALWMADLAFSIDNVLAAVAFTPNLWLVIAGVFIGILAMRFVTGYASTLMERYPVLNPIAYVLVGLVGGLLLSEHFWHLELHGPAKMGLIFGVIAVGFAYERFSFVRAILSPVCRVCSWLFGLIARLVNFFLTPLSMVSKLWSRGEDDKK